MFDYPRKTHGLPRLNALATLLVVVSLLSGCSTPSKQVYENPEFGIRLEKPGNWSVDYVERGALIWMKAEDGMPNKGMAYIEIYGNACLRLGPDSLGPEDVIKSHILRIQHLYDLDSVTIVQEPAKVETGELEVTKAVIVIPTLSMAEDSARIQVGDPGPDIFQTIEMSLIQDSNHIGTMVYVYKGNSETLNAEAEGIVDSIRIICPAEP